MATQISVNSATGNVTVNVSRTAIGQIVNANTANTANALNAASTANVVIGGGLNGYVLATNGAGVTSWVEQTGGGAGGNPGGSNTQVQYNKEGTFGGDAQFTFNDVTNALNVGSITATNIGNITPTNLDGNTANYLDGTGTFKPVVAISATSAEQVVRLCRASETITKGQAVTITGGTGVTPNVSLSNASNASLMPSIGIALENIALNATGNVGLYGEIDGIDTTAFTIGDSLFVSATIAGALTATAPTGEANLIQTIGKVIRVNANGIVMIQGAGRTNANPNLNQGNIFIGNANNESTTSTLTTNIVPEGTNLYYTDTRSRLALSTTTATASSGGALAYDNASGIFTFTPADIASVSDTLADVLFNGNTSSGTDMLMSTTDAIFFRDANTSINSTVVGILDLNSTVETQITSPYIDLAAANVNMDGNLDITGMFTGNAGGASNIVGANVTGAVPFATTANAVAGANVSGEVGFATTANSVAGANVSGEVSFAQVANSVALANVSGAGNIATLNLDGNTANYLSGTGVWGPIAVASANFANFAGNVTVATQSNITLTGNLVSFTTNNATANTPTHQIDPALITMSVNYPDTKAQEVINLWGDDNTGNYYGGAGTTTYLMNDVNTGVEGYAPIVTDYAGSNGAGGYYQAVRSEIGMDFTGAQVGTDAYAPGRVFYEIPGPQSDLTDSTTSGTIKLSQGGFDLRTNTVTDKNADGSGATGLIDMFHYGTSASDATKSEAMYIQRRRGNNASRQGVIAGDYIGNISWAGRLATGYQNSPTKIAPRVDAGYNGTDAIIPLGVEIHTTNTSNATQITNFYANGATTFPGNITALNSGIFTGDGGGLSNVSATATPGGFIDSVQFNNSGVLGGDATLTYNSSGKELTLNGAAAGVGGIPTFNVNNGGFNITQEEIGGGAASFTFKNFYAGTQIAPSTYFRARGTLAAQTQVAAGDQILNEGYNVNSGPSHTYTSAGATSVTVTSNDGLGNIAVNYQISTANPTSPNSQDKIDLNSKFVTVAGNIQMNDTTARFMAGRIAQQIVAFNSLPASPVQGERAMINNGPPYNTFGTVVSGGSGTNTMPLFYDGSNWRMG
jgi:hypothetical protein